MEKEIQFRNSILIKDIDDFNLVGQDIVSDLVADISKNERYLHHTVSDDGLRYLNTKGVALIERTQNRLGRLARKMFSEEELDYLDLQPYNLIEE